MDLLLAHSLQYSPRSFLLSPFSSIERRPSSFINTKKKKEKVLFGLPTKVKKNLLVSPFTDPAHPSPARLNRLRLDGRVSISLVSLIEQGPQLIKFNALLLLLFRSIDSFKPLRISSIDSTSSPVSPK